MLWDVDMPIYPMSTWCQLSSKFKFQKKCLFVITLHEWTWLLFFYKQGLVSTNFNSVFLVFHSSSSSTFLYTYSYHYSAEINIESNQIISGLILYHYLNKILNAIQSYRLFVINLARKDVIVALENQLDELVAWEIKYLYPKDCDSGGCTSLP